MTPPPTKPDAHDYGDTLERIERDVDRLRRTVYGNGASGFSTRLALLEERTAQNRGGAIVIAAVIVALAIIGRLDTSLLHFLK